MKIPPMILGASALAPIVGAIVGLSLNTEPLVPSTTSSLPAGSPIQVADAAPVTRERLPDHYALETPDGVVEVHELSFRGRQYDQWRENRAREARYEADLAALEARWAEQEATYTQVAAAPVAAQPVQAPPPLDLEQPAQVASSTPVTLAVAEPQVVTPRMINVATTMARR